MQFSDRGGRRYRFFRSWLLQRHWSFPDGVGAAHYPGPDAARIVFWLVAGVALLFLAFSFLVKPRHREPQLSWHRLLKDAVRNGSLKVIEMAGDKPNVHSREHLSADFLLKLLKRLALPRGIEPLFQP